MVPHTAVIHVQFREAVIHSQQKETDLLSNTLVCIFGVIYWEFDEGHRVSA